MLSKQKTSARENREESLRIASILAGDAHLFHDLIRPYERGAYVMALSVLKNKEDAEDVTQEAFLKAFRNLAAFRAESKFSTWLMSIVLNEARNRFRHQKILKLESLDGPEDEDGHISPALLRDWREIPSEALERMEVRHLLQQTIESLPAIYRDVLVLRDIEQLSVIEAAEVLGITVASVKVRLHRARIMMQKSLAPQLKQTNPQRRWLSWF